MVLPPPNPALIRVRPSLDRVPDVRTPNFHAEAHRQSAAIAASWRDAEDQAFIDAASDWGTEMQAESL